MRHEAGIGIRQHAYLSRTVTLGTPAAACDLHGSRDLNAGRRRRACGAVT